MRNRLDRGSFPPHQPDRYSMPEKHHEPEGASSPRSQAPAEHMEPARREDEGRAVRLRHRGRGGRHVCSHLRTTHSTSKQLWKQREGNALVSPQNRQRCQALPGTLHCCRSPSTPVRVPGQGARGTGTGGQPSPPDTTAAPGHAGTSRCSTSLQGQSPTGLPGTPRSAEPRASPGRSTRGMPGTLPSPPPHGEAPSQSPWAAPPTAPAFCSRQPQTLLPSPLLNPARLRARPRMPRETTCAHRSTRGHTRSPRARDTPDHRGGTREALRRTPQAPSAAGYSQNRSGATPACLPALPSRGSQLCPGPGKLRAARAGSSGAQADGSRTPVPFVPLEELPPRRPLRLDFASPFARSQSQEQTNGFQRSAPRARVGGANGAAGVGTWVSGQGRRPCSPLPVAPRQHQLHPSCPRTPLALSSPLPQRRPAAGKPEPSQDHCSQGTARVPPSAPQPAQPHPCGQGALRAPSGLPKAPRSQNGTSPPTSPPRAAPWEGRGPWKEGAPPRSGSRVEADGGASLQHTTIPQPCFQRQRSLCNARCASLPPPPTSASAGCSRPPPRPGVPGSGVGARGPGC